MCNTFLCECYQQEAKVARQQVARLRQQKRYEHWLETIDMEIETAQQCVDAAQAKIAALHEQREEQAIIGD